MSCMSSEDRDLVGSADTDEPAGAAEWALRRAEYARWRAACLSRPGSVRWYRSPATRSERRRTTSGRRHYGNADRGNRPHRAGSAFDIRRTAACQTHYRALRPTLSPRFTAFVRLSGHAPFRTGPLCELRRNGTGTRQLLRDDTIERTAPTPLDGPFLRALKCAAIDAGLKPARVR